MKTRTGYLHKRGKNWYVSWRVDGKLYVKALRTEEGQPVSTRRDAQEARDRFMSPLAHGSEAEVLGSIAMRMTSRKAALAKWDEQRNPALALAQAWSAFMDSPEKPDTGDATLRVYEYQWARFVEWVEDTHPDVTTLKGVTAEMAGNYAAHLHRDAKVSANTFNKHLNVLTLVYSVLEKRARLEVNHWKAITRKKLAGSPSRRELTVDELRKVCSAAKDEMRTLFALGIFTGLRLGDAATLRWGEVDLERGIIRRVPSKTARRRNVALTIPIHSSLHEVLSETRAEKRGEYVLPKTCARYVKRVNAVTDGIQEFFEKNEIKTHKPGTGKGTSRRAIVEVGFHSLRHSFVSLCRQANAPMSVVESLVGHSSPAMTRHYTHTDELSARRAVAALPSVIGEPKPEEKKPDAETVLREVVTMTKSMTAKTWKEKADAITALVAKAFPSAFPSLHLPLALSSAGVISSS